MRIKTIHIRGFDSAGPVCGTGGHVRADEDWTTADNDPRFKRCRRCEKKLGPGGLERLQKAVKELAAVRAAHAAGETDARARRPSQASAYPVDSPEAQSYRQGYDTGRVEQHPEKEVGTRTITPGFGEFLATLEAAKGRTHDYNDDERSIITRAITRANRSLANRPTACNRTSGPVTERLGFDGPITHEFTATCTQPAGHAGCHQDENIRTAAGHPFIWGDPFRRAGAAD